MKLKISIITILVVCLLNQQSYGALNAYMRLTGETQGEIKGSVTQAGREDSIMVVAYSHVVSSPRDAASGMPTGRRSHQPIRITKEVDKSSPLLMNALVNNELIYTWELRFWQPSKTGQEFQFYTIQLIDAHIVGISQEMLNNKYPENMQHKEREHITFVYDKIIWTYEDGGVTADDDWSYAGGDVLISDLSGDGMVTLIDLAMFAAEWLEGTGGPR